MGEMKYNKSELGNPAVDSISIYQTDKSEYKKLNVTESPPGDDVLISFPFHLTISNQYRNTYSINPRTEGERIWFVPINSLIDFSYAGRTDCSQAKFEGNHRCSKFYLQSDCLVFDIDNDDKGVSEYWDDFSNHLTIEKFTELFKEYEFLISTSENYQKPKEWRDKNDNLLEVRDPRDKFHVFMPLGRIITDYTEYNELVKKMSYYLKEDKPQPLIDEALGAASLIFGNRNTQIFYNKGGSIYGMLNQEDFSDSFRRHLGNRKERGYSGQGKNQADNSALGTNTGSSTNNWDFINIVEPLGGVYNFYQIDKRYIGDGRGYWSAYCELHDDTESSLLVFNDGGFECRGCKKSGGSALYYESLKTGNPVGKIREQYCKDLGISRNDFRLERMKDRFKGLDQEDENDDRSDDSGESDAESDGFEFPITSTNDTYVDMETYEQLRKLNLSHAVLSQDGNTNVMLYETTRHSDDKEIKYSAFPDFRNRYKNRKVRYKYFKSKIVDGEQVQIPVYGVRDIGTLWENWDERRQYDGLDFHPYDERKEYSWEVQWDMWDDWETADDSNNWKGQIVKRGLNKFMDLDTLNLLTTGRQFEESRDGCSLYLDHIDQVICGNYQGRKREALGHYLICWMSKCLTTHGKDRVKVAPVLQGRQGTGKGTMVSLFGEIFGRHFLHIQNSSRLTDNFNIHMMDKLLVYVNEAVFGGNRSVMNMLKGLLTEDEIQLEAKYMNSFTGRNHLKFIYSSNEDWVVPVEWDDRRYLVIDISDQYTNNPNAREYFTQLRKQWYNGNGKEHLYKFLTSDQIMKQADELNYEYDRPKTTASVDQLLQTDPVVSWLQQLFLDEGHDFEDINGNIKRAFWSKDEWNTFPVEHLYSDFQKFNRSAGRKWSGIPATLSKRLKDIHSQNGILFRSNRISGTKSQKLFYTPKYTSVWEFGPLDEVKEIWVDRFWGGDELAAWGVEDIAESESTDDLKLEGEPKIDQDSKRVAEVSPDAKHFFESLSEDKEPDKKDKGTGWSI